MNECFYVYEFKKLNSTDPIFITGQLETVKFLNDSFYQVPDPLSNKLFRKVLWQIMDLDVDHCFCDLEKYYKLTRVL